MSYDKESLNGSSRKSVRGKEEAGDARRLVEQALEILGISEWVSYRNVFSNGLYICFIVLLGVIYVSNTHTAEKTIRKIHKKEKELKEKRWEYMTQKSNLMSESQQTEVARKLEATGIRELQEPPNKIVVGKRAY